MRWRLLLALCALPGCVFCPDLQSAGYTPCEGDEDCPAGRFCDAQLCAPPPWNDEAYGVRRELQVKNNSTVTLEKGTAVPVLVGGDGVLSLDDVAVDGRFTDYDRKDRRWRNISIFRDVQDDRYTAWIPLSRALKPKAVDTLAWVETKSESGEPTQEEDPTAVFQAYASFSSGTLDGWFESSPGSDPPLVRDGVANVADNQALVLQAPLTPPVSVTFLVRVNGTTCDEVFIGLVGTDQSVFNDPPSAGLFVVTDLQSTFQVAPEPDSATQAVGDTLRAPNRLGRVTVSVDRQAAFLGVDDERTGSDDLRPGFTDASLFAAVQVGGACSVDIDSVWATPLPLPPPKVTAGGAVQLKLRF